MSKPSPTWGGTTADLKERAYTIDAYNVIEYTEVWTGKVDDANTWPNYTEAEIICPNVGNVNLGNLAVYSIDTEIGRNKALAHYVIKASNKFSELSNVGTQYSCEMRQVEGRVIVGAGFPFGKVPWFVPSVNKISKWLNPPNASNIGMLENPPADVPFAYPNGWPPPEPVRLQWWGWMKTAAEVSKADVWQYSETWAYVQIESL